VEIPLCEEDKFVSDNLLFMNTSYFYVAITPVAALLQHQTLLLQHHFQQTNFMFYVQKQSKKTEKFFFNCLL